MRQIIDTINSITYKLLRLESSFSKNGTWKDSGQIKDITYYRDHIFTVFIAYLPPFALLALIPGTYLAIKNGTNIGYIVAAIDFILAGSLIYLIYSKSYSYKVKKIWVIILLYTIAVFLMIFLGSYGPGIIYLMAPSIIMSLIFNKKVGILSLLFNLLACLFLSLVIEFKLFNSILIQQYSTSAWIAFSCNIMFMSFINFILINILVISMEGKIKMLLHSEARQSGLLASQTNYVLRTDINMKYVYVNDKFKRDFSNSCTKDEFIGDYSLSCFSEIDHPKIIDIIKKCINEVGSINNIELEMINKDNETFTTIWDFVGIKDETNSAIEIQGIGVDISDRIKAERKFQLSVSDLYNRNRELETYAYIISHNLRSPIANINALISLIEVDKEDEENMSQYIKYLKKSSQSLDQVLTDLSRAVTIAGHTIELTIEPVDLHDIFLSIKYDLGDLIGSSGAKILLPEEKCIIKSHKSYLYSIIYNIVYNAIRFRKTDIPVVKIEINKTENFMVLSIKDNGIGIDLSKDQDDLFRPYKKLNDTSPGKGLGLFFAKKHVDALGGKLFVESTLGLGTTFSVHLPINR